MAQVRVRNTLSTMLGAEKINSQSFRHTHATILAENGAEDEGISGRLGHKNLACTQNTYVHNTPKLQKQALDVFNKNLQTKRQCK